MAVDIVYQIKVTLRGTRPPIWRRLHVPKSVTLHRLHGILQVGMGWTDSHLHQFRVGDTCYGTPDPELDFEVVDEKKVRLEDVLRRPKARMVYEYDFGDGWEHDVVLESAVPAMPKRRLSARIGGQASVSSGGRWRIGGYYHFLEVMADVKHPEHRNVREWCGEPFDPDAFDVQEINREFHGRWRSQNV